MIVRVLNFALVGQVLKTSSCLWFTASTLRDRSRVLTLRLTELSTCWSAHRGAATQAVQGTKFPAHNNLGRNKFLDRKFFRKSCGLTRILQEFRAFPKVSSTTDALSWTIENSLGRLISWLNAPLEYETRRVMSQMLSDNICDIATVILLRRPEILLRNYTGIPRKFWSKFILAYEYYSWELLFLMARHLLWLALFAIVAVAFTNSMRCDPMHFCSQDAALLSEPQEVSPDGNGPARCDWVSLRVPLSWWTDLLLLGSSNSHTKSLAPGDRKSIMKVSNMMLHLDLWGVVKVYNEAGQKQHEADVERVRRLGQQPEKHRCWSVHSALSLTYTHSLILSLPLSFRELRELAAHGSGAQ